MSIVYEALKWLRATGLTYLRTVVDPISGRLSVVIANDIGEQLLLGVNPDTASVSYITPRGTVSYLSTLPVDVVLAMYDALGYSMLAGFAGIVVGDKLNIRESFVYKKFGSLPVGDYISNKINNLLGQQVISPLPL